MKPRFILVKSPTRKITNCDQTKLDSPRELKPIKLPHHIQSIVLTGRVSKGVIVHSARIFGLSIPTFRTIVSCQDDTGEMVTYHSILNCCLFIPAQVLAVLIAVILAIEAAAVIAGILHFPGGRFGDFVVFFAKGAIIFLTSLIGIKFIYQFGARKTFRIIGDEVEHWLSH